MHFIINNNNNKKTFAHLHILLYKIIVVLINVPFDKKFEWAVLGVINSTENPSVELISSDDDTVTWFVPFEKLRNLSFGIKILWLR